MFFTATNRRTFEHMIRQSNFSQWDDPVYPEFGRLTARMQPFSTLPALSNQNAYDLSEGGFFYTGNVFYKQNPVYYKNKHFLEEPASMEMFLLQE